MEDRFERVEDQGEVIVDNLTLKGEGRRRNDDSGTGFDGVGDRRDQVGERFACPGARLNEGAGSLIEGPCHGFCHGHLTGPLVPPKGGDGEPQ